MHSWFRAPVSYQNWDNTVYRKKIVFGVYHYRKTYHNVKSISSYHKLIFDLACSDTTAPLCFMKENNSNLMRITEERMHTFHSKYNVSDQCTILYMPTLTDTQWVPVSCDELLITNIVCSVKQIEAGSRIQKIKPSIEGCSKNDLLLSVNCYLFMWFDLRQYHDITSMLHMLKKPSLFSTSELKLFHKILNGINMDSFTFFTLTMKRSVNVKHLMFKRELFTWKTIQSSKPTNGVLTWVSKPAVILPNTENIVRCNNGLYFSTAFILFQSFQKRCPSYLIKFNASLSLCNNGLKIHDRRILLPFFFVDRKGQCQTFQQQNINSDKKIENNLQNGKHYHCSNSNCLDNTENRKYSAEFCMKLHQFPCKNENRKCFNMTQICRYRLDIYHHIIPCTKGSHLQDCTEFDCNAQFKCPSYYCIPWGYICDAKWDCPTGFDEYYQLCKNERNCTDMFTCKDSHICLHIYDTCDGFVDCPHRDDEMMCQLSKLLCPFECVCLNFAILCKSVPLQETLHKLPFVSISITNSNLSSEHHFVLTPWAIILNFSRNVMCDVSGVKGVYSLFLLDVSFNRISIILSFTFSNLTKLIYLDLNDNEIYLIESNSFYNISSTFLLNLANNQLQTLSRNSFKNINKLISLVLYNNPLHQVHNFNLDGIAIKSLLTNNYLICCTKLPETTCYPHVPRQTSCSPLLPKRVTDSLVLVMIFLIISCNAFSLGTNVQQVHRNYFLINSQEKRKLSCPYQITVCFINAGNLLYAIYLILLWFADVYYGKAFFTKAVYWKESFVCFLAFTSNLLFYLMLPIFLIFLSILRYMVIKYPLNCRFKSTTFVMRTLFLINFIFLGIVFTETTTFLTYHGSPNSFCSPFMDQSKSVHVIKVNVLSVTFIQLLQIFSCVIMQCNTAIVLQKSMRKASRKSMRLQGIISQLCLLTSFEILSWIPSSLIHVMCLYVEQCSNETILYTAILCTPINSIFSPLILLLFEQALVV